MTCIAAIVDKKGKKLLSWRVQILPYIEQDNLYKQFKLDEPWDSEHNKKLIRQMPRIYMLPAAPISYEFGVDSDLGFYTYGTEYGLNGAQHTGLDIAVARNTPYRSPGAGTVMCSGTGVGAGSDGGGCAAFEDTDGHGAGRSVVRMFRGKQVLGSVWRCSSGSM